MKESSQLSQQTQPSSYLCLVLKNLNVAVLKTILRYASNLYLGLPTPVSVNTSRVSNTTAVITWEYPPPPFQPIQSFLVSIIYSSYNVILFSEWSLVNMMDHFNVYRWLTLAMLNGEVQVTIWFSLRILELSQWLVQLPWSQTWFPVPTTSSRSLPSRQMEEEVKCPALL